MYTHTRTKTLIALTSHHFFSFSTVVVATAIELCATDADIHRIFLYYDSGFSMKKRKPPENNSIHKVKNVFVL